MRVFASIPLQGAQVVGVPEPTAQFLEQFPITDGFILANLARQRLLQIASYPVVIQQRVIDIKQDCQPGPPCLVCFDAKPIPIRETFGNSFFLELLQSCYVVHFRP